MEFVVPLHKSITHNVGKDNLSRMPLMNISEVDRTRLSHGKFCVLDGHLGFIENKTSEVSRVDLGGCQEVNVSLLDMIDPGLFAPCSIDDFLQGLDSCNYFSSGTLVVTLENEDIFENLIEVQVLFYEKEQNDYAILMIIGDKCGAFYCGATAGIAGNALHIMSEHRSHLYEVLLGEEGFVLVFTGEEHISTVGKKVGALSLTKFGDKFVLHSKKLDFASTLPNNAIVSDIEPLWILFFRTSGNCRAIRIDVNDNSDSRYRIAQLKMLSPEFDDYASANRKALFYVSSCDIRELSGNEEYVPQFLDTFMSLTGQSRPA